MKTSTSLQPCHQLEAHLQHQWQLGSNPVPLQIRCAFQHDRLLVLAEHPEGSSFDSQTSLALLTTAVEGVDPSLGHELMTQGHLSNGSGNGSKLKGKSEVAQSLQVGVYLRVQGAKKPYAVRGCFLRVPEPVAVEEVENDREEELISVLRLEHEPVDEKVDGRIDSPPEMLRELRRLRLPDLRLNLEVGDLRLPLWVWATGVSLCLFTFVGSFWIALQPCVIRACEPLTRAERLGQDANALLRQAENWQDLQGVEVRLKKARDLLKLVPGWTTYRDEAAALDLRLTQDLAAFEPITIAFQRAIEAVNQSQNPPHPLETWQAAQGLWEAAIAQLKTISSDNPTYHLAQHKLVQYQNYLKITQYHLQQEKRSAQALQDAENTAALAEKRQPEAKSLEDLKSIQANWQRAVRALQNIPQGTTAHQTAQEHLKTYPTQLSQAEQKVREAQFSANLYDQALEKAREAKEAEKQQHWEVAADRWNTALTGMQQIPENSFYYTQAQTLAKDYSTALWNAELQSKGSSVLDQARNDLAQICAGTPIVCHATVTPDLITIQLTLEYQQAVLAAGAIDDQHRAEALSKLQQLETSLENISNNTKIPLKLYDPDGTLIGSHTP
jgi:hypothetical protein